MVLHWQHVTFRIYLHIWPIVLRVNSLGVTCHMTYFPLARELSSSENRLYVLCTQLR